MGAGVVFPLVCIVVLSLYSLCCVLGEVVGLSINHKHKHLLTIDNCFVYLRYEDYICNQLRQVAWAYKASYYQEDKNEESATGD